jgi:hypothetical protein
MSATIPRPPLHPLSALATMTIDSISTLTEIGATATVVGAPLVPLIMAISAMACLIAVALIERFAAHKGWGEVLTLGIVLGVLTALPYFFLGGIAGCIMLGWAGLYALQKPPPPG